MSGPNTDKLRSEHKNALILAALFAGILGARLCHAGIVWVEEAYPSAAAIQMLCGESLYRDFWFDKPPLFPSLYLLWGAQIGVPLRIAGALFVFSCCILAFLFARALWTQREGIAAALLLGFFLTFGIPSAVMALAPDLLMVLPHLAAIYLAFRLRPFWAGIAAGIGVLVNPKAVYVLVACLLWTRARNIAALLAGFSLPNIAAFVWFGRPYYDQVWRWGMLYSTHTFLQHPFLEGLLRTLNWAGFQSAMIAAGAWFLWRERSLTALRFASWAVIMFGAVLAGWRFFPRYYFALLPPFVLIAARGFVIMGRARAIAAALLLIPLIRFGPRYVELANDLLHNRPYHWSDLALSEDSQAAARAIGHEGTLLVWGYRPDIFVYTRMRAGTPFLDSQPLTGVIADRHLTSSDVVAPELAAGNRDRLVTMHPDFIADGLGPLNPNLTISNYPDLKNWLDGYREVARTTYTVIYKRAP